MRAVTTLRECTHHENLTRRVNSRGAQGRSVVGGGQASAVSKAVRLRVARLNSTPMRWMGSPASAAEAEPHHRMALGPVVAGVDVQTREQFFVALEQLLQRVQKQALAEAAGA